MTTPTIRRRSFLQGTLGLSLAGATLGATEQAGAARPADASWENNEAIRRARQAALDVLKPTPAQLEHGLELHANSIVFDGYGFAPRCAVDGEAMAAAVEAGASKLELQDLRERMSMTRCATDAAERAEFEQAWKAAGVTCIFQNAGEEGQDPMRLIKRLAHFTYLTDMMPEFVAKAVTPGAVATAKEAGRHCLYFSGNGVPLRQQW